MIGADWSSYRGQNDKKKYGRPAGRPYIVHNTCHSERR
jgi:hypothetical protein